MIPFEVIRDPAAIRARAEDVRRDGVRIAVVPTMGALHEGHRALLTHARRHSDVVIATLFVNPTQFGPGEDFGRYPRQEPEDLDLCRQAGVDLVFAPTAEHMYGPDHQTVVQVGALARGLCGDRRPGHFAGVATVVTKLFHLTRPHLAVFGQKDYQQLAIIRQLTRDLDFGIEIAGVPTVREADGLALSSRNRYLAAEERTQAAVLFQALQAGQALYQRGERDARALEAELTRVLKGAPLVRIDYAEVRDADTLVPLDRIRGPAVMAVAAYLGQTRLIDNAVVGP